MRYQCNLLSRYDKGREFMIPVKVDFYFSFTPPVRLVKRIGIHADI